MTGGRRALARQLERDYYHRLIAGLRADGFSCDAHGKGMPMPTAPRSPTVLIADDEEAICFSLAQAMRRRGWGVYVVADGRAAVELFAAHPGEIDAAVLDVRMPRLDGCQALGAIRRLDPGIRCCLITAFDNPAVRTAGADAVLLKPFDLPEFMAVAESLVGLPRPDRPAAATF